MKIQLDDQTKQELKKVFVSPNFPELEFQGVTHKPKLVAAMCGFGVDGLGFYYFTPPTGAKAVKDNKSTLIKVIGGTLARNQLIKELRCIVPVDAWEWEV